jgi:riboflavin transporter FmnP
MVETPALAEIRKRSKSQAMTGIALFAALALVLNLSHIQIPAPPPVSFLIYEFWEIPIIVCLFIFGFYASLTACIINAVGLILINQGASPSGPIFNLIAVTVTLLAIVAGHKVSQRASFGIFLEIVLATGLAMLVRTAVMSVVNYVLLPLPYPLGFTFPDSAVVPILPLIGIFNATLVLYSVPLGYAGVRAVVGRLRYKMAYPIFSSIAKK